MIYTWHILDGVTLESLKEDEPIELQVGEKKIGLLKQDNEVFAFAATCPHAGAKFCEGWVDGQKRLVCPLHKYRFDPKNGRNTSGEGYKLKTYPVNLEGGKIQVGLW